MKKQVTEQERKIWIALPAMDERDYLPTFIRCLRRQDYPHWKLVVNVNQPEAWWENTQKIKVCQNNRLSVEFLEAQRDIPIEVIDCSGRGKGMIEKMTGVGWARKIAMDRISEQAGDNDIIISLDADTVFNPGYFSSILNNFNQKPSAVAISVPYYHLLTGDEEADRAILHYEIYMRYYAINLWRIGDPYSFTAIGSAIALPVRAYRAIGGITPRKSGEDFYFLLKLRKYGEVITWNPEKVFPAARYSDRVGFGTGPAMIKGRAGEWASYPVYRYPFFDEIKRTTELFPLLFEKDIPTPMDAFLIEKFGDVAIWEPLRKNFRQKEKFVTACHHKVDAFRILQYLKWKNKSYGYADDKNLVSWLRQFYPGRIEKAPFDFRRFSFEKSQVPDLDFIRNLLVEIEEQYQKQSYFEEI